MSPAEGDPAETDESRRSRLLAAAGSLLLSIALFPRAAAGIGTFFHYDTWMQNLAFRAWWFEQLKSGHFATWCPGMFAGFPLFAETQTGPLYPPVFLLFLVLPPTLAFSWNVLLHFAFAGLGTYLLARRLGAGTAGAALAAVAFEASGFLVTHVVHFNLLVGAAWMPWVVWLTLRTGDGSARAGIGLALAIACLLLGAHPYATLMSLLLAALTLPFRAGARVSVWGRGAVKFALLGGLGAALAAVQLLPTADFLPRTTRGEPVDWTFLTFGSWEPWRLPTLAAPDLFGTPVDGSYWAGVDWSHYAETCAYVGVLALALAVVAVASRSRLATFPAVAASLGFLLMLGKHTPVYHVLSWLPVLQSTRLPSRFALVLTLSLSLLAGVGLDALLRERNTGRRRRALALGGIAVVFVAGWAWLAAGDARDPGGLAGGGQLWPVRLQAIQARAAQTDVRLLAVVLAAIVGLVPFARRSPARAAWAVLPIGLLALELISWGRSFNPVVRADVVMTAPPVVDALPAREPRPRVFRQGVDEAWERLGSRSRIDLFTPAWRGREAGYASGAWTLTPNCQLLYGVDSGEGFTSLLPLDWLDWMGLSRRPGATPRPDLSEAQADLLAIDAVVSTGSGIAGEGWESRSLPGEVWLSQNLDPLPRVRLARSWEVLPRDRLLERVRGSEHDPRRAVLLESRPPGLAPSRADGPVDLPLEARESAPGRWEIEVPEAAGGLVVVAERYDPDWRAVGADGADVELLRADGLFLAFVAPRTGGTVVLRHAPSSLRTGAIVSLVAVFAVAALAIGWRRRGLSPLPPVSAPATVAVAAPAIAVVVVVASMLGDVGDQGAERGRATLAAAAARAWSEEATAAWRAGASAPAAELLRRAEAVGPADATTSHRLGLAERSLGREREAIEAFRRALEIDPTFEPARQALSEGS